MCVIIDIGKIHFNEFSKSLKRLFRQLKKLPMSIDGVRKNALASKHFCLPVEL